MRHIHVWKVNFQFDILKDYPVWAKSQSGSIFTCSIVAEHALNYMQPSTEEHPVKKKQLL